MSIDIDWSKAPEGATHHNGDLAHPWLKESPASYFTDYADWVAYTSETNAIAHFAYSTPRPKAPEAEWVDGLPPVGCECEVKDICGGWHNCEIVGHHRGQAVLFCDSWTPDSDYDALPASWFRPIRTKDQRQRDELKELVIDAIHHNDSGHAAHIADAILSRYNLEPKQ